MSALWKGRKPEIICGFLCLIVLGCIARIVIHRALTVETDNATLQGYAIPLMSKIEGEVVRVFVVENEPVKKGQLLCELEQAPWRARLQSAEADLRALQAQQWVTERDLDRADRLLRHRNLPYSSYDQTLGAARALRGETEAAQARVIRAREDLERTRLVAPADGVIAFRTARVGMLAQPEIPLFGFVDSKDRWILARVREADLSDLHVGKAVDVRLDAASGKKFHGTITSLGPATERPFLSAVVDDPAAGNFTKYVQWQPIRIDLALSAPEDFQIAIGTSAWVHMSRD
jgi:membrane fusion protein (multidrug efflux system)